MSQSLSEQKVSKAVRECEIHLDRMRYAMSAMERFMPLGETAYARLSMDDIQVIDQFVFRFSKLQDAMGERLFRAVLEFLEEEVKTRSFLDILNRLEQLGALESREQWLSLRIMRNNFAHEYDDDAVSMSETLNTAYAHASRLEGIFGRMREFASKYSDPAHFSQQPQTYNDKP